MKPIAILLRIVLAAALLGAAGAAAQVGAPVPGRAAFDAAERALQQRLGTPEAARVFRQYNASSSQKIQDHLLVIYRRDPAYVRDAGGAHRPLGDGIVGPLTLKWLTQFCRDYGIVASDPHFEQAVVASLEQVAGIAKAYPEWVDILSSREFERWINAQKTPDRVRSLQRRRSGDASQVNALIAQFQRERMPAAAPALPVTLTFGYDPERPRNTAHLALVAERLKRLAGRSPETEEVFEEDVQDALSAIEVPEATLELVKRYSRVDAYRVSAELLQQLRREGLPGEAVKELKDALEGEEYHGVQDFQDALREVSDPSEHREAIERKRLEIVRGARVTRFQVPATLGERLAADAPPKAVTDVFGGFAKVEYPTRKLFDAALEWQVRRALGMCREARRDQQGRPFNWGLQGRLGDDGILALGALMPGHEDKFKRIGELRAGKAACSSEELVEADMLVYDVARFVTPLLAASKDFEIHNRMPTPAPATSDWAPDWCRCARPEREGMTYGFYPLWLDAGERKIDFGALTRIGLYGLSVDDDGALRGPPGMDGRATPPHIAAMMRAAHRHDVKVDWVVSRSDWSGWNMLRVEDKRRMLGNLAKNIEKRLKWGNPTIGDSMTWLASLGVDHGPTGGDGVTLHFSGFPVDDKPLFNEFVRNLSATLNRMRPARRLSMAIDYDDLGRPGPLAYRNLIELIEETNPLEEPFAASGRQMLSDMPLLVLIPEPTQDSKKALRTAIQNALHGAEAARLQWAVVPVVSYDGVGSAQLADDIVFASANYHGIGFWPLAFAGGASASGDPDHRDANHLLGEYLQPFGDPSDDVIYYAGYLCPHRLWLRWVFWGSLALAAGVGAVYFSCRGCNERLDNSGLYFAGMVALLALPVLTLLVLVVSDPLLTGYLKYTLALYGTGGIVAAALVSRHYFNKSRRKLP